MVTDPPSIPNFEVPVEPLKTQGTIYIALVMPCTLLFAHKAPAPHRTSEEEETSTSLLVIDSEFTFATFSFLD